MIFSSFVGGFVSICHPCDSRLPAKVSAIDAFEKKLRYQLLQETTVLVSPNLNKRSDFVMGMKRVL
ncbi:hypothetical protein Hanom_Chr08g00750441 [Helianthus anomalus]